MPTEPTAIASFEEKMKERIRAGIGDMMPDEALAKIIERGIEEAFFKFGEERTNWGEVKKTAPWIVKLLQEACHEKAEIAVNEWIKKNSAKLDELAKATLENGITTTVMNTFARLWQDPLDKLQTAISDKLAKLGDLNRTY